MVDIRSVPESDLEDFRLLHNAYVDRDESLETIRNWHLDRPESFIGAYDNGVLVGHCLGLPRSGEAVELAGIAVEPSHQRRGIGTALLSKFEERVACLGFRRVTLGSAGGYVDEFYVENGYSPESVLVRLDPDQVQPNYRDMDYEVVNERIDEGTKKLYIETEELDPSFVEGVREVFDDPDAIYIMSKALDTW